MKQIHDTPETSDLMLKTKQDGNFIQQFEEVFKQLGMDPKWDYSRAGQTVIIPARKKKR